MGWAFRRNSSRGFFGAPMEIGFKMIFGSFGIPGSLFLMSLMARQFEIWVWVTSVTAEASSSVLLLKIPLRSEKNFS